MIAEISLFWLILAQLDFRGAAGGCVTLCLSYILCPVLHVLSWKHRSDNHFDKQVVLLHWQYHIYHGSQIKIVHFSSLVKVYIAAEHFSIHISKQCPVL